MWERGLKQHNEEHNQEQTAVAPHVGAWIETRMSLSSNDDARESPCGGVGGNIAER